MENNNYNNTENNSSETVNTTNTNEANNSGAASQQESGSTYSYSYLNQDQKNPNNIWRAEENTAGAYTANNAYTNAQQDNDYAYGSAQTGAGGTYSGAQPGTNGSYGGAQSGTAGAYGSTQTGAGGAYSSTQAGTGGTYSSTQSGAGAYGSAQSNGAYNNTQYTAGGAQSGADNAYSNIYGAGSQTGWNTSSNAKQQKKEERARKRAARKEAAGTSTNFGIKLAKCASIALVFGLVAGTAFEGSSYVAGNLLGANESEASVTAGGGNDQEVQKTEDSTKTTAQLTASSTSTGDGVSAIVEQCMPSIVAITNMSLVQYQTWFGQLQTQEVPSAGSGIIVSEDEDNLYIATNNHVVESATTLTIRFCDDKTAAAEIKGTDASTDLAVIKVKKADIDKDTLGAIKIATLGDSGKIKVGSQAIAIGNALGYGQSVTAGYISALEREVTTQDETTGKSYTNKLIQTDAAINPGNSGGALLNSSGEVIGINSSKYNDTAVEGMGFAIPANTAKPIIEDLITKSVVSDDKAAYLGIHPEDVTAAIAEAYNMPEGVFVREVFRGTAAEQYGLRNGDIITKIDGREVKDSEALVNRLSYYEAGTEVEITLQRAAQNGYEEVTISVVLGKKDS